MASSALFRHPVLTIPPLTQKNHPLVYQSTLLLSFNPKHSFLRPLMLPNLDPKTKPSLYQTQAQLIRYSPNAGLVSNNLRFDGTTFYHIDSQQLLSVC